MEAATDHVLFGLECIESICVDTEHLCEILHLILIKTAGLTGCSLPMNLLVNLHELRDALFAKWLIKAVDDRLREVFFAEVL